MVWNNFLLANLFTDFCYHYFGRWNTILAILFLISVFSLTIFFERLRYLRKSEIDTGRFVIGLRGAIEEQNIVSAIQLCEDTKGAIAQIIKAGLLKHEKSQKEIESAMEVAGKMEISKLEHNTKILSIVAHIAPLIGLLGTVLGFIQAFGEMRKAGLMDISANRIGEAMEYALVTTAAGLLVAIPAVIGYNYLVSRIRHIVLEIETASSEVVDLLLSRNNNYEV